MSLAASGMALWWADSPAEGEEAIVTFSTTPEAWTPYFLRGWPDGLRLDGADVAQLVSSARLALRILRPGELPTAERATGHKYMGGTVALDMRDDGAGFDPGREFGRTGRDRDSGGFGLKGMRERVEGAGGVLTVESAPGEGSTLTVELPVIRGASPSRLESLRAAEEDPSTTLT